MGYTVLKLNDKTGKILYGTYYLEFFEGPVYVDELDPDKKLNWVVKLTISPNHIELPTDINLEDHRLVRNDDYKSFSVKDAMNKPGMETPRNNYPVPPKPKKLFDYADFSKVLDPDDKF